MAASDKVNLDQLVYVFDLPTWDDIEELNRDYISEVAGNDYEDEDEQMAAQERVEEELYSQWHGAVIHAAERLFVEEGLELTPVGHHKYPYEYRIIPERSWNDALSKIVETINGVGMFRFSSVREFMESIPTRSARQAVLSHWHVAADSPEVYGGHSARRIYEHAF